MLFPNRALTVVITETESIFCAVLAECLNEVQAILGLERDNYSMSNSLHKEKKYNFC